MVSIFLSESKQIGTDLYNETNDNDYRYSNGSHVPNSPKPQEV